MDWRSTVNTKDDPSELFKMIENIGSGSYGDVYKVLQVLFKAMDTVTGQICAVKIICLEPGEDLSSILGEVNFLKQCKHENIVSYVGCYLKRGKLKGENHIWVQYNLNARLQWNSAVEVLLNRAIRVFITN